MLEIKLESLDVADFNIFKLCFSFILFSYYYIYIYIHFIIISWPLKNKNKNSSLADLRANLLLLIFTFI